MGAAAHLRRDVSKAVVSAVATPAALVPELTQLVQEVQALETSLTALFEPGKAMPKAAVVARMREEIEARKLELAELLEEHSNPSAPHSPPYSSMHSEQATQQPEPAASAALQEARHVLNGYARPTELGSGTSMLSVQQYSVEFAQVELENLRLREKATVLLLRQAQLEEVAQKAGVRVRLRSPLTDAL